MPEAKTATPKMVKIEFDAERYSLFESGNPAIYGVPVEAVTEKDDDGNEKVVKYVGECTAEEKKAFEDAGRI